MSQLPVYPTLVQSIPTNLLPKNADSFIIGIVTAATATIYFIFLVYFDWMRHSHLPALRQQIWSVLHYPFHLALVLFMQGFTQFIIWGKVMDVFTEVTENWPTNTGFGNDITFANVTSSLVAESLTNSTNLFFELYPPKYSETWDAAKNAIKNISTIDSGLWPLLDEYDETGDDSLFNPAMEANLKRFSEQVVALFASWANGLFNAFGIDLVTEQKQKYPNDTNIVRSSQFQLDVSDSTQARYRLVVRYSPLLSPLLLFS